MPQSEKEDIKVEVLSMSESTKYEDPAEGSQSSPKHGSVGGSFLQLNDAADEFFDFPDEPEHDEKEVMWSSDESMHSQVRAFFHSNSLIFIYVCAKDTDIT